MATTVYLESTGAVPITPAVDAAWDVSSGLVRYPGSITTKAGSTLSTVAWDDSNATDQDITIAQWIIGPIGAGNVTGDFELRMRCFERISQVNARLTCVVRVIAPDGTTVRGTPLALTRDGTEMSVGATFMRTRRLTAALTTVAATNGDYVVVDVGSGGDPDVGADHDYSLRIGSSAASDLTTDESGSGSLDDLNPFLLFSTDLPAYAAPTAAVTGTATASITEADIVAGGKTLIITLTNDTWVTAGGTFDAQRQNIINGLDSAQAEGTGWNAEVRDKQGVSGVVRTSDTVVTITLDAQAAYNITAQETITVTVPGSAVTGGSPITATPTFTVATDSSTVSVTADLAEATAAGVAPVVTAQRIVSIGAAVATATALAVPADQRTARSIAAAVAAATAAGIPASDIDTQATASITAEVAAADAAGVAADQQTSRAVTGAIAEAIAAGTAPVIDSHTGASVVADVAEATAAALPATIQTVRSVSIVAVVAEATAEGVPAVIDSQEPTVASATAEAIPATVQAQIAVSISGAVAQATAAAAPSSIVVERFASVSADVAEAPAAGVAPTLAVVGIVTVVGATATATAAAIVAIALSMEPPYKNPYRRLPFGSARVGRPNPVSGIGVTQRSQPGVGIPKRW